MLYISWLIALNRTSSPMLDTTGKSWHPSLIPDLIGKAFNILSLSMMLAEGLQCMTFIMLECFFLCPFY